MKIVKFDRKAGVFRLIPENVDDVWTIGQIVGTGDRARAKTVRKIKLEGERKSEVVKKAVFLILAVESSEFSEGVLRLSGKIIEGTEDVPKGQYHTITITPNTEVEIEKDKWLSYQIQRVEEAAQAEPPKILICVFDREDAAFARLTRSGYELISKLKGEVQKKRIEVKESKIFFEEIILKLREYSERYSIDRIILASPAFWKDEMLKLLTDPTLKNKIILATVSGSDENSIREALRRPETQEALRQERTAKEMGYVEQVLAGIAKGSAVAYGIKEVKDAAESGAVSTLLVTDSLISRGRQEKSFEEIEQIMRSVEDSQGIVVIISSSHDGGKKLDGLGGIAAILRYRLS